MRHLCGLIAAAAILAPVQAQAINAPSGSIENVRSLDLAVQGTIRQRCAIGSIADIDFGDLNRAGLAAQAKVALDCNIPFKMKIQAQNGALAHSTMPSGQGPYAGAVPYQIALAMPVRRPQSSTVTRTFAGHQLSGNGANISSEGGIAVDGLAMSVSLGKPSGEAGLLAGEYGETIEITITPE